MLHGARTEFIIGLRTKVRVATFLTAVLACIVKLPTAKHLLATGQWPLTKHKRCAVRRQAGCARQTPRGDACAARRGLRAHGARRVAHLPLLQRIGEGMPSAAGLLPRPPTGANESLTSLTARDAHGRRQEVGTRPRHRRPTATAGSHRPPSPGSGLRPHFFRC